MSSSMADDPVHETGDDQEYTGPLTRWYNHWWRAFYQNQYRPFCTILDPPEVLDRTRLTRVKGVLHDDVLNMDQQHKEDPGREALIRYTTMEVRPGTVIMVAPGIEKEEEEERKGEDEKEGGEKEGGRDEQGEEKEGEGEDEGPGEPWLLLVESVWLMKPDPETEALDGDPKVASWEQEQLDVGRLPSSCFRIQGTFFYRYPELKADAEKADSRTGRKDNLKRIMNAAKQLGLVKGGVGGPPVLPAEPDDDLLTLLAFSDHGTPALSEGEEPDQDTIDDLVPLESVMGVIQVHWLKKGEARPRLAEPLPPPLQQQLVEVQQQLAERAAAAAEAGERMTEADLRAAGRAEDLMNKLRGRGPPLPGFLCPLFLFTSGKKRRLHWLSEVDWDHETTLDIARRRLQESSHARKHLLQQQGTPGRQKGIQGSGPTGSSGRPSSGGGPRSSSRRKRAAAAGPEIGRRGLVAQQAGEEPLDLDEEEEVAEDDEVEEEAGLSARRQHRQAGHRQGSSRTRGVISDSD